MAEEPTNFPNAAQLAKRQIERQRTQASIIYEISRQMNLKVKAFELAALFPTTDPVKLATEIYNFISALPDPETERDSA